MILVIYWRHSAKSVILIAYDSVDYEIHGNNFFYQMFTTLRYGNGARGSTSAVGDAAKCRKRTDSLPEPVQL